MIKRSTLTNKHSEVCKSIFSSYFSCFKNEYNTVKIIKLLYCILLCDTVTIYNLACTIDFGDKKKCITRVLKKICLNESVRNKNNIKDRYEITQTCP